jgi:hypothetical protein
VLFLELALPEAPDLPAMKQLYGAAFHEHFAKGLAANPATLPPDRLQLLVIIGQRITRTEGEAQRNQGVDMAAAMASGSLLGIAHSALGPKGAYEDQVARLGYRPSVMTGQVVVLRSGKDSFQTSLKLTPYSIIKRMRPLGENGRASDGILAEESRAVALEALDLLKRELGWVPPTP